MATADGGTEARERSRLSGRWSLGLALRWLAVAGLLLLSIGRDDPARAALRTRQAAAPYSFDLLGWQVERVLAGLGSTLAALRGQLEPPARTDLAAVRSYFLLPSAERPSLRAEAHDSIQRLVTEAWREEGLTAPSPLAGGASIVFPPVQFTFADPPLVLIVSPRERIAVDHYVLLEPGLDGAAVERLEQGVARRGWSTLVTTIGGLATYPAMVLDGGSAQSILSAVAHEWVHAYLFFYPLGRGYWADQEVRTINETAAELAGDELGRRLAAALDLPARPRGEQSPRQREFNRLLRETRLEVDRLLAAGQVAAAEAYMEQRRLELNERGFPLRRLNQAYFAFHGSYAEGPAGSSPVAGQVRRLRQDSASLGDFLRQVAQVGSPAELRRLVEASGGQRSG